jgi:transposase InsO family protein
MIGQDAGLSTTRKCAIMDVSRSDYYDWLKRQPSNRAVLNIALDKRIQRIYDEHAGRYGYRRICDDLRDEGLSVSLERVRRRMKRLGLQGIQKRKFKHTTDSKHNLPTAPNLLNQCFEADAPNTKWVADITYIRVKQQWLYLAVVVDLYSRKVIGWTFGEHINARLVCDALKAALFKRGYPSGVIVHTDRGSQYCSQAYLRLINAYDLKCSMSGKGNCYDNAACESFFHTLKVEHVYRIAFESMEHARREIFWFIEAYYNLKRKHSKLGYQSPVKFESAASKIAA